MDDDFKQKAQKSFWQKFKDSFKPADARADDNIAERHLEGPTQYDQDKQESYQERLKKTQKGFLGQ